jgi:hypothetical protein
MKAFLKNNGEVPATVLWIVAWSTGIGGLIAGLLHILERSFWDGLVVAAKGTIEWSILLTLYCVWDALSRLEGNSNE